MTPSSESDLALFAKTNFRNQDKIFGIKTDDRRRHMYLIGKTGMGKTTVLENMVISDIRAGRGLALVDPHGDLVEKVIDYIPSYRINDVIYLNPADLEYPIGFNVLENINPDERHLVASGLMGVFTKIWEGVWSARMEYILNNCILALLENPGSTMLGISRLLVDKKYRKKIVDNITDPIVKSFWVDEFASYNERFRNEAIAPIQNKVGQFLSSAVIRNIVGQPKSTIDLRNIMDSRKILLVNLAKGRIGEDNSALLGAMMITRIMLAAMSRVDIEETKRKDFYLYVDEFQNFASESFANILSEARKYRLNLIIAHQYIEQLDETVRAAVFGNIGTLMCFRVGAADAEFIAKEFFPIFNEEDLLNLTKFTVYLKLMIDGIASEPFSATTLPPLQGQTNNKDKVISVSRERYSKKREIVENKITRWTGVHEMHKSSEEEDSKRVGNAQASYASKKSNSSNKKSYGNKSQDLVRSYVEQNKPSYKKNTQKKIPIKELEEVQVDTRQGEISLQDALQSNITPFQSKKKIEPISQLYKQKPLQKKRQQTVPEASKKLSPGEVAKL